MPFDLGATVRLTAVCLDPGGAAATAATAAVTITLPDGTTATPAVPDPVTTGQYTVDYVPTVAGQHAVRWVFTTPASAYTDSFDVRPAVPGTILSLTAAREHLTTTPAEDAQLREWLETITEGVEGLCGAVVRRTVTETQYLPAHGTATVALRTVPVLELVSATPVLDAGNPLDVAGLDLDGPNGIVQRIDGAWMYGPTRWVYVAGRAVTPASLTSAAKIIIKHLWRVKYGSSRAAPGIGGGDDFDVTQPVPGFGYAIPNRALQLMEPFRLPPGTA